MSNKELHDTLKWADSHKKGRRSERAQKAIKTAQKKRRDRAEAYKRGK